MKYFFKRKKWMVLLISLSLTGLISCEKNSEKEDIEIIAEHTVTKENLIGDWKLISSKIDNEAIGTNDFTYLKESSASFKVDNSYVVIYKKRLGSSSSITTLSGTYTIGGLNRVTFFNSESDIKLINETLQITSTTDDNKTQVDVFIKSDNEEFELNEADNEDDVIEDDEADDSETPNNSYDGSAIIAKIQGVWKINNVTDECLNKNTIEFKTSDLLVFIQHKKTFSRTDLIKYNINVSYPMPKVFSASVTKGHNTVTFDTDAECRFIKESKLNYTVTDAQTIMINEVSQLTIKILNDTTINLIYKYEDENSDEQVIQFSYKKV